MQVAGDHDPDKVVADLAMTLALGGDCRSDITILRVEPELLGLVPSDPTLIESPPLSKGHGPIRPRYTNIPKA